jgi:hypothetical protein
VWQWPSGGVMLEDVGDEVVDLDGFEALSTLV